MTRKNTTTTTHITAAAVNLHTYEIRHRNGANYGTVDAQSPEAAAAQLGLSLEDVHVSDWGPATDGDYI